MRKNSNALMVLARFFACSPEELGQYMCSRCEGEGSLRRQFGQETCPICNGCGYAAAAFARRAFEILTDEHFSDESVMLLPPANPDTALVDALSPDWYTILEELASRDFRSPRQQLLFMLREASGN